MCRSAMSYCDLFATYLRYRRWVAFRSQCDIHFGDIAATYISYWVDLKVSHIEVIPKTSKTRGKIGLTKIHPVHPVTPGDTR